MRFEVMQLGEGWTGTNQTVEKMIALANNATLDPVVVMTARNLVRWTPERDVDAEIAKISAFVRRSLKYQREGVETLATPRFMLNQIRRYGNFVGDCDEATTLWAALHKILGHHVRLVVVSLRQNGIASHVYGQVFSPGRGWIPDDTIARPHGLGWEVARRVSRKRYYYLDGGIQDVAGIGDTRRELIAREGNEAFVYNSAGMGIIPLIIPAIAAVAVAGASVGAQGIMSKKGKKFEKKMKKKQEAEYKRQEEVALAQAEEAEEAARKIAAAKAGPAPGAGEPMSTAKMLAIAGSVLFSIWMFARR